MTIIPPVEELSEAIDKMIEDAVIGGTDDFPIINRVSLLGDLTELQHRRAAEAGENGEIAHPTPKEAAADLREYARKRVRLGTCMPGDNIFEDAASVIDRLSASPPATGVREQCLAIIDQMETEWRAKGWEDEAAAACDIAARINSALVEQP